MKAAPTLAEYIAVLRRRLWLIVLIGLTAVGLAILYSALQTPMYMSTVNILINQNTSSDLFDPTAGDSAGQADRQVGNEVRLLRSQLVRLEAETRLGFAADIEVEAESRVDVVVVTAIDPDPVMAQLVAQTFAEAYLDVRRDQFINERLETAQGLQERIQAYDEAIALAIEQDGDQADIERQQALRDELANSSDQLTITAGLGNNGSALILDEAVFPDEAFSPQTIQNAIMALALGIFVGVGAAFLLESLDNSIRSRAGLEALTGGIATLAAIPTLKAKSTLVTLDKPDGPESEVFRTFRAGIEFASLNAPNLVIQITSPGASAGKTTVAGNLAVVMANAGKRVAIVDGDLRRPRVHTLFEVPQVPGLSSMIIGLAPTSASSHAVDVSNGQLSVFPSGPVPPGPSELLGSEHAERTMQALRKRFDVIIVDSAPVLPVADALVLSRLVDSTVVVVNAQTTRQGDVVSTLSQLEQAGAKVIGTVLNRIKPQRRGMLGYGYGYGYGYGHEAPDSARNRFSRSRNDTGRHAGTATMPSNDVPTLTAAQPSGFADPVSFAPDPASSPRATAAAVAERRASAAAAKAEAEAMRTPTSGPAPATAPTPASAAPTTAPTAVESTPVESPAPAPVATPTPSSFETPTVAPTPTEVRAETPPAPPSPPLLPNEPTDPPTVRRLDATIEQPVVKVWEAPPAPPAPPAPSMPVPPPAPPAPPAAPAAAVEAAAPRAPREERKTFSTSVAGSGPLVRPPLDAANEHGVIETDADPTALQINHDYYARCQARWLDEVAAGRMVQQLRYIETHAKSERAISYEVVTETAQADGTTDLYVTDFRTESISGGTNWQAHVGRQLYHTTAERLYRRLYSLATADAGSKWQTAEIEFEFCAADVYQTRYSVASADSKHHSRPERKARREAVHIFLELARRHDERGEPRWDTAVFSAKRDKTYGFRVAHNAD